MSIDSKLLIFTFVAMIASNVIGSVTKLYNDTTNADLSAQNPTAITPDNLTFAIWGPIYVLQFCTAIYQCRANAPVFPDNTRNWLTVAFILNAVWLPFFAYRLWWLSLLTIIAYAFSLRKAYLHMKVNYSGPASVADKICGFAGVSMNLAWIVVATLLNTTIVFRNSNIVTSHDGKTLVGGNTDWAIACIALATAIAGYHIVEHGDFIYALTTAWALFGVYRMQTHAQTIWAVSMAVALCAISLGLLVMWVVKKYKEKKTPTNELERPIYA